MRLGRTMTLSTRAQYHSRSLNSIRNVTQVRACRSQTRSQISSRSKPNVEDTSCTSNSFCGIISASLQPSILPSSQPLLNGAWIAWICRWTRLALSPFSESLHPVAHSPKLETSTLLYSWLSCCPNDLPVYLLLVQSHLRKACLWACMEEGMNEGDGVVGDEGASYNMARWKHSTLFFYSQAGAPVRMRRRRQRYPTPLLYNCCPHCCAHLLSQSTSLRAQAPLGTAGHATCPATVGLHGSPVVRTSFTAVYLQVWSYTNSLPPLFLHLCILAS
ncbi:hypothetical protein EDB83DRAFT_1843154 [Lactarius deliciosus]|nr:hypothetical protein EDB83DRAFT_1843154 [Lactarius deliciosus]